MHIKAEIRVQEKDELLTKPLGNKDEAGNPINILIGTKKIKPGKKDLDGFFAAKTEKDFRKLMAHYSMPAFSFYGNPGVSISMFLDPESGGETWLDYENYKKLLETSRLLQRLIETRHIYKGHLTKAGISVEAYEDGSHYLSLSIPLMFGGSTFLYLERGAHHCTQLGLGCYLMPPFMGPENSEFELEISAPLDLENRQKDEQRIYYEGCLTLQNTLNTLMLQDLRLNWLPGNKLELISPSFASSIWCALLGTLQKGRIGVCPICSNEFIAQDSKNRKRFCSNACRKKNERFRKFLRFVDEGFDEAEAAKQAGVKLENARDYRRTHESIESTN